MRLVLFWLLISSVKAFGDAPLSPAAEEGYRILTERAFMRPFWPADTIDRLCRRTWNLSGESVACMQAMMQRFGLNEAPYPNDGLPAGLRWSSDDDGQRNGLTVDCMICHAGSVAGVTTVGIPNAVLNHQLFEELDASADPEDPITKKTLRYREEQRRLYKLKLSTRPGMSNVPGVTGVLVGMRTLHTLKLKPLWRRVLEAPLFRDVLIETKTPAWWTTKRKKTIFFDGSIDARDHRALLGFVLYDPDVDLDQMKAWEPEFKKIAAYVGEAPTPAWPENFPFDAEAAARGKAVYAQRCQGCHGTLGQDPGTYPNRLVDASTAGFDPRRAADPRGPIFFAYYNRTWFAEYYDAKLTKAYQAPPLDGIWARAPFLHNASVPTLHHLLRPETRPAVYTRCADSGAKAYDTEKLGWRLVDESTRHVYCREGEVITYDARVDGYRNTGHASGMFNLEGLSDQDLQGLTEFLKRP